MRLLILLGLFYLVYRFLKSWMFKDTPSQHSVFEKKTDQTDGVMVKDPYCGVYFAKKDGVHLNKDGQDFYFCSKECKDKFLDK